MAVPKSRARAVAAPAKPQPRPELVRQEAPRAPEPVALEPPSSPSRLPTLTAVLVGLVAFVAYLVTLQRSVPTGDSGELITVAHVWGVAHPPGYPLFTILGHVFGWLPFGSVAFRANMLSALLDAAAVSVVFVIIHRLIAAGGDRERVATPWAPLAAAATGALLLAFSSTFWEYSVVAEVFPLNNLFAAVLLLVGLEWARRPQRVRLLWLFTFLFGLSLTNQQTIVTFLPAFLVLAYAGWTRLRRATGARGWSLVIPVRDLAIAVGLFAAGLLPYLYLPLAASRNPVMDWGAPTTFARFRSVVTRSDYGTSQLVAGGEKGSIAENLRLLGENLTLGFVIVGIALAAAGLWWALANRARRLEGIAVALAFFFAGPVFVSFANTSFPDELTKGIIARFYILPRIPLAILAGLGAWQCLLWVSGLVQPARRAALATAVAAVALVLVPAASAIAHYDTSNQRDNHVARNYGRDILDSLKPNALLLMRSDENFTAVNYAQYVDGRRPDVVALDTELLKLPAYVVQKRREHPELEIPFASYDGGVHTKLADLVRANLAKRPVYTVGAMEEKRLADGLRVIPGVSRELLPAGSKAERIELVRKRARGFLGLHYPRTSYPSSSWENTIAGDYAGGAFELGLALQNNGDKADTALMERLYRTSIDLGGAGVPAAYKNLGVLLNETGGNRAELVRVWTRYLELVPDDPQADAIRAAVERLRG